MIRMSLLGVAVWATLAAAPIENPPLAIPATTYQILASGAASGDHPTRASAVKLHYTGAFPDGTVFTRSDSLPDGTVILPLRGLIPGFQSALMLMRRGDEWRVTIPPEQAYGAAGSPLSAKTLVFDVTLIDFAELAPTPPPAMTDLPKH